LARRAVAFVGLLGGCSIGAPPGFSEGSAWTFPLVDPLADGRLVTPVMIDGKGPFLFAIDLNTRVTIVDSEVFHQLGITPAPQQSRLVDQLDHSHATWAMTLPNLRIGDLTISLVNALTWNNHLFDADGRRIYGVFGRDVIADSLVFGVDRDRGVAWLKTQQAFTAPTDARVLEYHKGAMQIGFGRHPASVEVVNELVSTKIDAKSYQLAFDFGRVDSELRPNHWAEASLVPAAKHGVVIDELGSARETDHVGIARHVEIQGVERDQLGFVTYEDRRGLDDGELEGTLGLSFFEPFAFIADWDHEKIYLKPRVDSAEAKQIRMSRWGALLPCGSTGCAAVQVSGDTAPQLQVTRDPSAGQAPLELVVAATAANGDKLPTLTISLPAGVGDLATPLDARYAGAKLDVIDASPFPRACDSPEHCVTAAASD